MHNHYTQTLMHTKQHALAAFHIVSLSSVFSILITMCLGVVLFVLIHLEFFVLPGLENIENVCFLSQVREIFSYYVLICILCLFLFSRTPVMQMSVLLF